MSSATHLAAAHVALLRDTLLVQRDFRRDQLTQLDAQRARDAGNGTLSAAHREIYLSLAVGATTALQDAEDALARIAAGRYGRCTDCGDDLPVALLDALPHTARCLPCRHALVAADRG